jgi:hypothetical protein
MKNNDLELSKLKIRAETKLDVVNFFKKIIMRHDKEYQKL